ncbi:MAG: DUF1800 domain-containing protein [Pseudomonadota bacterium]
MPEREIALNRFGLGARGDEVGIDDPRGWLKMQLRGFEVRPQALRALPIRSEIAAQLADNVEAVRALVGKKAASAQVDSAADPKKAMRKEARQDARGQHIAQVGARMRMAVVSETPFIERLVHFWANHFAVSADKLVTVGFAGMLEFEAIRSHVLGRFGDMLLAVEQHPAMLLYLDQAQSIGPDSPLGSRITARGIRKLGLNENLAREILELHTLGVRTGYGQNDVTEFARAMTGWTVAGIGRGPAARALTANAEPGAFLFVPQIHEPGDRTVLTRRYPDGGEAQARAVLADLAIHPATAEHIVTKLAQHFVADDPPPALVARLKAVFLKTGGDLPSVYAALIDAPEAWVPTQSKFKTPWEWSVSTFRALGVKETPDQAVVAMLAELGQPVWRPGSPAGYDDVAVHWAGPDALMKRVEVAQRLASRVSVDARALGLKLFGGALSADTQAAIARAGDGAEAVALLLVSPEFMRR